LYVSIYTSIAYFIAFMIGIPIWLIFSINHGHVKTFILGIFLIGLSMIPYLWITTLEEAIIFSIFRGFADSTLFIVVLMILSDVYDEVTLATGKHQEATLQGISSFFARIAAILQAVIITSVHIFTGYNSEPLAKQSNAAIWGIRIHMALIPIICCLLAGFLMIIFYDLKGEKQQTLKYKLRERGL
ncbi:MAG: MFS transporter, partial [Promethearchaeota archaeon]